MHTLTVERLRDLAKALEEARSRRRRRMPLMFRLPDKKPSSTAVDISQSALQRFDTIYWKARAGMNAFVGAIYSGDIEAAEVIFRQNVLPAVRSMNRVVSTYVHEDMECDDLGEGMGFDSPRPLGEPMYPLAVRQAVPSRYLRSLFFLIPRVQRGFEIVYDWFHKGEIAIAKREAKEYMLVSANKLHKLLREIIVHKES